MKKLLFILFLCCLFFPIFKIQAQEPLAIVFFHSVSCPHCIAENTFLDSIEKEYGNKIEISRHELSEEGTVDLKKQYHKKYNVGYIDSWPVTFVDDKVFFGYDSEKGIGADIKQTIDIYLAKGNGDGNTNINGNNTNAISTVVDLPFIGKKDLKEYSLPVLSVIIGALDGFNPCAMWVLVFLITLLIGMDDKWRRWLYGSVFIGASTFVYFLFMAAWLNFLMFLGYTEWIRSAIGIFGVISGVLFLRDYRQNKAGVCKVTNKESRRKIFDRLKELVKKPSIIMGLLGIILLAFTVNLVELACSLGFPAIFTQILSSSNLPSWQYYGYILLYLFFFMLDDIIVFIIAMLTLKITGLNNKYSRYSSLIGGILILLIGILLIFKPEWLMFN